VFGGFVRWRAGSAPDQQQVETVFAQEKNAWPLADVIVLLDKRPKTVRSSVGHLAAWSSPLFAPRLAGLPRRLAAVEAALAARDLGGLGAEIEAEALEMHGVMLSSTPRLDYLAKPTSAFLAWVREARHAGELDAFFTMDAGPNVHLICQREAAARVAAAVARRWPGIDQYRDEIGSGPVLRLDFPTVRDGAQTLEARS